MTIEELLRDASLAQQKGDIEAALALCDQARRVDPGNADVLRLGGVLAFQVGRYEESLTQFRRLIADNKADEVTHLFLGATYLAMGRHSDAVEQFDTAIARQPALVEARRARAEANVLLTKYADALKDCDWLIGLDAKDGVAHFFRGHALRGLNRFDEALDSYLVASSSPDTEAAAQLARGKLLFFLQRLDEAASSFLRVTTLLPTHFEAHLCLGAAQLDLRQPAAALQSFDRAIALQPSNAEAHSNRGFALKELRRFAEAKEQFSRALMFQPESSYVRGARFECAMTCCDWRYYHADVASLEAAVAGASDIVSSFSFMLASGSARLQLASRKAYAAQSHPAQKPAHRLEPQAQKNKINVAFMSSDFRQHPVGVLVAELLEQLDRKIFTVTGVVLGQVGTDPLQQRLFASFDKIVDIRSMTDAQAVAMIVENNIDIAIDLNGDTRGARMGLFARRPAPIQVNFLGFSGTMGAPYYDYIIADSHVIPRGADADYSEAVVRLPDVYQPNPQSRLTSGKVWTREESGLPSNGLVLCAFNNAFKINPPIFEIWMKVLRESATSVLWLSEGYETSQANLRREALSRGIPAHRLVFAPWLPSHTDHLQRMRLADLFLDTWPYNAHTTAGDSLWAGVPVLTCSDGAFAGRVAGSLLKAVGLPELVTDSLASYESTALRLVTKPDVLQGYRQRLSKNIATHPLFDSRRYTRHFELALTEMYKRWQSGRKPEAFDVPTLDSKHK